MAWSSQPVHAVNARKTRNALSIEWWLVIVIPVLTIIAGAAMIHVASSFGFTALGQPVVQSVARDG